MATTPQSRPMKSDAEIAQSAELVSITKIAEALGIRPDELEPYGHKKAKVSLSAIDRLGNASQGRLILVTAMTATRSGDGKTCTSIGLAQGMGKLGVRHVLCLRQPSLGPTFGIKGGAAGGGYAQVLPMEDINMHFTGDFHAITSAHNLLAAVIDNHIYFDNELNIDPDRVVWRRTIDLCDRQLRNCEIGRGGPKSGYPHITGFDITASSEVMAVLALSESRQDLAKRLARMVVAYNKDGEPITAGQLECVGAMEVLLKDALLPNLVQTIEHTPALVHCGPFANIAHGCNSILATKLGLHTGDYVITEAGFASDLGAEKFIHIKCRRLGMLPAASVLVVTCRALKMHGGASDSEQDRENLPALKEGFANVRTHVENLKKIGIPVVVAINRFPKDTEAELRAVESMCSDLGVKHSRSEVVARGGDGGIDLAKKVMEAASPGNLPYRSLYDVSTSLRTKIEVIAKEIYRADGVDFEAGVDEVLAALESQGFGQLPICMAKTQLSLSDDPKKINAPRGWRLRVRGAKVSAGAGFVVVYTGNMLLMPGMPKKGTVEKIGMDDSGRIFGLS